VTVRWWWLDAEDGVDQAADDDDAHDEVLLYSWGFRVWC